MTKFLNISTDNTLGGNSPSNETVSSQKAVKDYVDTNALTSDDVTSIYVASGTDPVNGVAVSNAIATKQDSLVSGTNIKTINGASLLGSGNIVIETSSTPNVDGETISYNSDEALQAIAIKNKRNVSTLPVWQGTESQWEQGTPEPWYYWRTDVSALWSNSGQLSASNSWLSFAYNNDDGILFAFSAVGSNVYIEKSSDNGQTWTSLPTLTTESSISASTNSAVYGGGKLILICSRHIYVSENNGSSWTEITIHTSTARTITVTKAQYLNGKFFLVCHQTSSIDTPGIMYSPDGYNWSIVYTSDDDRQIYSKVVYGNGMYVACYTSTSWSTTCSILYSFDGESWTAIPQTTKVYSVAFTNGVFVTASIDGSSVSSDGINWSSASGARADVIEASGSYFCKYYTGPSVTTVYISQDGLNWTSVSISSIDSPSLYSGENGIFLMLNYTGASYYSENGGSTWSSSTTGSAVNVLSCKYFNNSFIVGKSSSADTTCIFSVNYTACYTKDLLPTTTSTVYSSPEVESALTISSTASGSITLSDNNTYYYNQSGNTNTYQSIGEGYPDWLCFIDRVGVKKGNTLIASASASPTWTYDSTTETLTIT